MHLGVRSAALTLLEPPQFRIGIAKSALGRKDSTMRISIEGVVSQLMNQGFKSAVGRRRGADLTPKCKGSNPLHLQRVTYEGRSKPRGTATFRRYELVSVCGIWQWRRHSGLLSQRAFFGISFLRELIGIVGWQDRGWTQLLPSWHSPLSCTPAWSRPGAILGSSLAPCCGTAASGCRSRCCRLSFPFSRD